MEAKKTLTLHKTESRQLGRFKITRLLIKEHPDHMISVFTAGDILPVRIEYIFNGCSDILEYTAISSNFDIVEEGAVIPEYKLTVTCFKNGYVDHVAIDKI